ncbi:MAG: nitrous oxide reductase accessory protein NosL [Capnocytophaga sp.]|nr:nitrous oxide reductase accessory protein NosL [Capnocytophaga sp.]
MKQIFIFVSIASLVIACKPKPQPIDYGHEECHFCQMTIVDKQHAAEIVTNKSKAYKYDAIECMIQDNQEDAALFLVCDYATPEKLVDATKATFLVSENIPSPMGADLSAFESNEIAKKTHTEKGGKLFTWEEIKKHINEEALYNNEQEGH